MCKTSEQRQRRKHKEVSETQTKEHSMTTSLPEKAKENKNRSRKSVDGRRKREEVERSDSKSSISSRQTTKKCKSSKKRTRSVSFGKVTVREYERDFLVYPDCFGVFLAINWEHRPCKVFSSVTDFEQKKSASKQRETSEKKASWCPSSMRERVQILCDYGYGKDEIVKAIQQQRLEAISEQSQKKSPKNMVKKAMKQAKTMLQTAKDATLDKGQNYIRRLSTVSPYQDEAGRSRSAITY